MKFTMKRGTHAYIGSMPITFLEDTEVDVQANSRDHLAEMMASAGGQRLFGEHLNALKHRTIIKRNIDGAEHEVDVEVSYGAGGARVETDIGEPRKIGSATPGQQPPAATPGTLGAQGARRGGGDKATGRSGIGTETVPGASGTGAGFEGGRGAAKSSESDVPFVDPNEDESVAADQLRSVTRTEFVVPPKRFPDDVQTVTDPPRAELVADSPERETPFVGEFTQDGAFSRQPSLDRGAIVDRSATAGRPQPTPDTPGTRDREFPAPSTSAMELPDQTKVALGVATRGSDQPPTGEKPAEGTTGDVDKSETSTEGSDDLPKDFPHYELLVAAGFSKYSELEGKTEEELSGDAFPGIGPAKAADILAALKKKKRRESN